MTTATLTPTEFELARIAEDEAVARAVPEVEAKSTTAVFTSLHEPTGTVEMSPARVLAECEAKRKIVEDGQLGFGASRYAVLCLASVHADHPDYLPEWKV